MIGLANLDDVVKVIRSAKDSAEASEELQKGYLSFDLILFHVLDSFHAPNQGFQSIQFSKFFHIEMQDSMSRMHKLMPCWPCPYGDLQILR